MSQPSNVGYVGLGKLKVHIHIYIYVYIYKTQRTVFLCRIKKILLQKGNGNVLEHKNNVCYNLGLSTHQT